MSSHNDAMSISDLKKHLLHESEKNVYIFNVLTTQRATLDQISASNLSYFDIFWFCIFVVL